VRVLNQGGPANADVLYVERPGAPPLIVKDWGRRSRFVRRWLAPRLIAHELAALERLEGLAGVPRPAGRVGRHALAMEYLEGVPLQRHRSLQLPPAFFDALEGIIEGIAARGLVHLDLRSPTNVLCTSSGAPGIVDLGGAFPVPLPAALRRALHRSAIAKLRARFAARAGGSDAAAAPPGHDLKAGGVRFRLADEGMLADPVPVLLLHDVGLSAAMFSRELAGARAAGRRVLAPGLPPFGGSGRPLRGSGPRAQARRLLALLDALRIGSVDLAGWGFGAVVAGSLAQLAPDRVRTASTLGGLAALRSACADARAQREVRLPLSLPEGLDADTLEALRRAQATVPRDAVARALCEIDARALALAPRESNRA
jgi:pimeloyl-ACP methyl ester carboxylesterase